MHMGYKGTIAGLVIVTALSTVSTSAIMAQEVPLAAPAPRGQTIPDRFEQAFFSNDRDFYQNRSTVRQFNYMFGPGIIIRNAFPDNEIARDGRAVNEVYREVLSRQLASGPLIRTADLPSPFNQSVRSLPPADAGRSTAPLQPSIVETPPTLRPPQPRTPVPALW